MMPKQTDATDVSNAQSDLATLMSREASLRAVGNRELADVYQRAIREFQTGAVRGLFGTAGVNHSDVRK